MRQLWAAILAVSSVVGFSLPLVSQVPAGPPYRRGTHPNPIVTFVTDDDFAPATYEEAREKAGIELMGLSEDVGARESISVSDSFVDEVRILGNDTDVLFYPVVRQRFRLADGQAFVLYSFRDPYPADIPPDRLVDVLDRHAFSTSGRPEERRFGDNPGPEQLEFRGSFALLFDYAGEAGERVLFWQDERASHVAVTGVSRERLFRIASDLL